MTEQLSIEQWERIYRDALPPQLKPLRGSERVTLAAYDALRNGWAPRAMAALVARHNYAGAQSPPAVALSRMEDFAARQYADDRRPTPAHARNSGCVVCPTHVYCPDPLTAAKVATGEGIIPADWSRERWALIQELNRIPVADMGEAERAEHMRYLIADQKQRAALSPELQNR